MESNTEKFKNYTQAGDNYFAASEYARAAHAWEQAAAINSDDPTVFLKISEAYIRLADIKKALHILKKAQQDHPKAKGLWIALAKMHLIKGDIKTALSEITKLKKVLPNLADVHLLEGDIQMLQHRFKEAEISYRQALHLSNQSQNALIKLAICYLGMDSNQLADQTFKIVASMSIKSANVLSQMARFCKLKGNYDQAENYFLSAVTHDPKNYGLQLEFAKFYYSIGAYQKAKEILNLLSTQLPKNMTIPKMKADVLMALGEMTAAQSVIESIPTDNINDIEMNLLKGKYFLLNHQYEFAITHFKYIVEKNQLLATVHYFLGVAYLAAGKNNLARQALIRALTLNPDLHEAELALAGFYYQQKESSLGLKHAQNVAQKMPENYRGYMLIGHFMVRQRQYEAAIDNFYMANQIYPDSVMPIYYLANTYEQMGEIQKALKLYDQILIKSPEKVDAALHYTQLKIQARQFKEAETYLLALLLKNTEQRVQAYYNHMLGLVFLNQNFTEKARLQFDQAIQKNPNHYSSYMALAEIYRQTNRRKKEIQILEICVDHNANATMAILRLAKCYSEGNQKDKAITLLEKMVAKNPNASQLLNNLAWLYLENHQKINKAFTLAQTAYELMPNEAGIVDTLGMAYYQKGIYSQAEWYFSEAQNLKPGEAVLYYHLGLALNQLGQTAKAKSAFQQALALNISSALRKKIATINLKQ